MITWPSPQLPQIPGSMPEVKILDSTTERLVTSTTGPIARMYVCGVTPYDATHIGHAATYVAFDLLNRAWRDAGYTVEFTSNVTDVDDPLLERATATGQDWWQLAQEQTALFAEDMTALAVIPPDTYIGAVESVPQVASAISQMLAQGTAYRVATDPADLVSDTELGDVYADLSKDPKFGAVANLEASERLDLFGQRGGDPQRAGKRSPLDPLLWRRERAGEPAWDAGDLGKGRPGWHIECAVIAKQGLGASFDVQGGGSDLLFPHHEMSTSHMRVLENNADAGAAFHLHAGLVSYQGEKMSKSLGNLVFVSKLRSAGVNPMVIRLALLGQRYSSEWEWTDALLEQAQERYDLWLAAVSGNGGPATQDTLAAMRAALSNDLDAPQALAAVDAWAHLSLSDEYEPQEGAPGVISRAVNALLGVRL
ncbi:cysteine--1-D-myo-inosityl 2-amino-2-deoxy-alpha-D-glucopyranoside ligase [Jonesiaceae bacterium BS-20]|uniref:L-cysteine:1D-myo-inositol 2-amino-2-deoxy-alpha-D-glucopyranoside ligase n=1 Tax=Jonesiaceae bacterium BS-20 TaxID=3120821 RepID=A0AAU7DZV9_9MICO